MGAPAAVIAGLAKTRIGRRIGIAGLTIVVLAILVVLSPLIAIPFAVAGQSVATTSDQAVSPVVSGDWGYPLAGGYSKGRGFGFNPVIGCSYCTTNHKGYDMAQGCGATVYAAGPGVVITAGAYQGYGNAVRIDHGDGVVTVYGHMQWGSLRVRVGQRLSAGTPIGAEGNTGKSYGCHLHFEVRRNGTPIDPQPFMAELGLPLK